MSGARKGAGEGARERAREGAREKRREEAREGAREGWRERGERGRKRLFRVVRKGGVGGGRDALGGGGAEMKLCVGCGKLQDLTFLALFPFNDEEVVDE